MTEGHFNFTDELAMGKPVFRHWLIRRWWAFAVGVAAGLIPTGMLLVFFDATATELLQVVPRVWSEFLIGPVKTVALDLFSGGREPEEKPDPMAGFSLLVYAVCLCGSLAHPICPNRDTAIISLGAFGVWYGWAMLATILCAFSQL